MTDTDVYSPVNAKPDNISDAKFGIIALHEPLQDKVVAYVRVTKHDERLWRELRRLHPDLVKTWDRPFEPAEFKMLVGRTYRIRPSSCLERHTYHVGPNIVIRARDAACLAAFRKNVKDDPNLWTEVNPPPGATRRDLKIARDKLAAEEADKAASTSPPPPSTDEPGGDTPKTATKVLGLRKRR